VVVYLGTDEMKIGGESMQKGKTPEVMGTVVYDRFHITSEEEHVDN